MGTLKPTREDVRSGLTIWCPDAPEGAPELSEARSLRERKIVEHFAYYFRREFGYDFPQYGQRERTQWEQAPREDEPRPFLFTRRYYYPSPYVGAAVFRWREYTNQPPRWCLEWVWLHPYVRLNGYFTRAWPTFVERFAPFWVGHPLSPAMTAFLHKKGVCLWCWQPGLLRADDVLCESCHTNLTTKENVSHAS